MQGRRLICHRSHLTGRLVWLGDTPVSSGRRSGPMRRMRGASGGGARVVQSTRKARCMLGETWENETTEHISRILTAFPMDSCQPLGCSPPPPPLPYSPPGGGCSRLKEGSTVGGSAMGTAPPGGGGLIRGLSESSELVVAKR